MLIGWEITRIGEYEEDRINIHRDIYLSAAPFGKTRASGKMVPGAVVLST
jgi:hypothetical protein